MRALVTGFEPFDGDAVNPSWEAAQRIPARLGALEVKALLLPTSFDRGWLCLEQELDRTPYDIVVASGLAGGRAEVTLERLGVNLADARIADNDGAQPQEAAVLPDAPPAYFTTLPVPVAVAVLRQAGIPASASLSAGSFVCNAVLYRLLDRAERLGTPRAAGFVHLPCLPEQAARRGGLPSMGLEPMVRALSLVLAVTAETLDRGQALTAGVGS